MDLFLHVTQVSSQFYLVTSIECTHVIPCLMGSLLSSQHDEVDPLSTIEQERAELRMVPDPASRKPRPVPVQEGSALRPYNFHIVIMGERGVVTNEPHSFVLLEGENESLVSPVWLQVHWTQPKEQVPLSFRSNETFLRWGLCCCEHQYVGFWRPRARLESCRLPFTVLFEVRCAACSPSHRAEETPKQSSSSSTRPDAQPSIISLWCLQTLRMNSSTLIDRQSWSWATRSTTRRRSKSRQEKRWYACPLVDDFHLQEYLEELNCEDPMIGDGCMRKLVIGKVAYLETSAKTGTCYWLSMAWLVLTFEVRMSSCRWWRWWQLYWKCDYRTTAHRSLSIFLPTESSWYGFVCALRFRVHC